MDFAPSPRAADLTARVADFMAAEITPVEGDYHRDLAEARRTGDPWQPLPRPRGAQGEGAGAGTLEPLPAAGARRRVRRAVRHRRRRRAQQRRLRTARRADGALGHRAARVQLQRPRHRQHGGAAALRLGGAAARVAGAAPRRPDPVGVHDDRARGGVVRRDQHGGDLRRRRRRGGRQRPQVVVDRSGPPGLPDLRLHGRHRPRRRPPPPALDGPRAARHPRREDRATAAHDGDLRRAARSRRGVVQRRPGAADQRDLRAGRGLRDRPGAARPGRECTTACG